MKPLSAGMMLIKFNVITDANIRINTNYTNIRYCLNLCFVFVSIWINTFQDKSSYFLLLHSYYSHTFVYWHRFDSFLYRYYLLNYRQHVGNSDFLRANGN